MKFTKLKWHETLLKGAKTALEAAKKGGTANKTYINYWARQVKSEQKKIDALKK